MQQSWRQDKDKLTFITCLPMNDAPQEIAVKQYDTPERMLGDVNLFLTNDENPHIVNGEVELMIAVKTQQGQGYGRASLVAFLRYIADHEAAILAEYTGTKDNEALPHRKVHLRVKIGESNNRSISLFESVGFQKVAIEANYFGEFELRQIEHIAISIDDYHELRYIADV